VGPERRPKRRFRAVSDVVSESSTHNASVSPALFGGGVDAAGLGLGAALAGLGAAAGSPGRGGLISATWGDAGGAATVDRAWDFRAAAAGAGGFAAPDSEFRFGTAGVSVAGGGGTGTEVAPRGFFGPAEVAGLACAADLATFAVPGVLAGRAVFAGSAVSADWAVSAGPAVFVDLPGADAGPAVRAGLLVDIGVSARGAAASPLVRAADPAADDAPAAADRWVAGVEAPPAAVETPPAAEESSAEAVGIFARPVAGPGSSSEADAPRHNRPRGVRVSPEVRRRSWRAAIRRPSDTMSADPASPASTAYGVTR
jgi:hypothetical protein